MTDKPTIPTDAEKKTDVSHPGMMGDGAEEQNLDERGNPSARIEEDELDAAFGNQKNQRSSKPHHPFWEGGSGEALLRRWSRCG
jgi:hypothetical protein